MSSVSSSWIDGHDVHPQAILFDQSLILLCSCLYFLLAGNLLNCVELTNQKFDWGHKTFFSIFCFFLTLDYYKARLIEFGTAVFLHRPLHFSVCFSFWELIEVQNCSGLFISWMCFICLDEVLPKYLHKGHWSPD